jgi:hypothetical protein
MLHVLDAAARRPDDAGTVPPPASYRRRLCALLPAVVDVGETEQMPGDFAGRVITAYSRERFTPPIYSAPARIGRLQAARRP